MVVPLPAGGTADLLCRFAVDKATAILGQQGRELLLAYSEKDPFLREWAEYPPVRLRPVADREFELVDGEWRKQHLGFPRDDVVSFGIVAQRVR